MENDEKSVLDSNQDLINSDQSINIYNDSKWINNKGDEVKEVFGFNANAELINARAAMFGFLMLIITELIFKGEAVTSSIFGLH